MRSSPRRPIAARGAGSASPVLLNDDDHKLPEALIEGMDELVRRGLYPSRSAILRAAVRDLLKRELWGEGGKLEEE
jgi:hypothetical protein